ncbi:hypothetical protein PHAVU_007G162500 [Phaseolus vulgaris]|uniref:Two-component response regulator-like APRR7 n=1 Tax=Phaseolus vulgaris TaxID=3885 RepID=V7BG03_PHAVU|nr:hypothetical protein PHAVU_007G162500g [Phaseolus vulgaris]ESW16510.1 hypothetical protein PHAVU_007G162500g [Phaseolus vulgaris]
MRRVVQMSVDGDSKELKELSQRLRDAKKIAGGEHELCEGDEVKCNGVNEEVKVGQGGTVESSSTQQHIPQPQGAIVCWERFLHIRSLKVLLVENDDCTRHVVTALLRNCSYEVIDAANGLQAWKILDDLTNHIDLILTEVAMPGLSGIGLLYKIMGHKTRKNIPVVMMSSLDSMGLVFKCLSKGAVDFLVKPIRKNELKNLWQHVWRRCHSSSGSGSESGTQTQKSVKSKSLGKSDNFGSNDDDNGSGGLNNGDGSDNGSGTQSSWTKRAVEVDSPKPVSQWDQIAECPDSTCAQVVHSNAEINGNRVVLLGAKESPEQKEQPGSKHSNVPDAGPSKPLDLNCENQSTKLRCKGLSLSDAITSTSDSQMHSGEFEALNKRPKSSDIENKGNNNDEELPSLGHLCLKRLRGVKDAGVTIQDDRSVLRRSDQSAFSRYNAASNTKISPTGCVGSNSPYNNSLEVTKKDSSRDIQSHSSGNPPNQNSNGASNNIDMGSTTNNAYAKSAVISESAVASTKCLYQTSTFQPIKNNLVCNSQQVILHNPEDKAATRLALPKVDRHQDSAAPDFHLHHENHNCTADMHQLPPDHDAESAKKTAIAATPHCVSSSVVEVLVEGNVGNLSINRSVSGSNNGSNGQNGSSTAVNAGGTNMESNNGLPGNSGSGDASGSGSANKVDQNKTSQREAALTKFRQKRKERNERCFHEKVRYQSRKKLAEQRPRFRGQFARQSSNEKTSEATTER